ncbi:adenylate/guanylate cyclase domain-containing protein [Aliidongia dinghuensis]|uniref:Adenylate/guanylate cyclase domain-containing protein n=1 Tax=Aliidongia dinghuensis TaxID=1867774 RepID=A0A8J3E185_9PROT|nr:adenylate/guanylate cyclase domain-containing protein [Aliidongia dinghuensis]
MREWLASIGLGARADAFVNQQIEFSHLVELTDEDLKELGLTIGERKRLRQALKALADDRPAGNPARVETRGPAAPAERRPLTVVFVDIVDSAALGETLEPEDLLEIIRQYRELCGRIVQRYGGVVARFVGDGTLAYFSYPTAHEDDPVRAVRASVEIVQELGALETSLGFPLQVRIGVATGRVVISDLFAGGALEKSSIVGSTPNLAARLQALARPNGIVVAAETYVRVRRRFECEDLGSHELKGFKAPVSVYRVLGDRPTDQKSAREHLTPFQGRSTEVAALQNAWQQAAAGRANAVLLVGDAGIGKSRLVAQFLEHIPPEAALLRFAASPFDLDSPLHPVIEQLRESAGIAQDGTDAGKLDKIRATLAGSAQDRERALPVIAELLRVPCAASDTAGMTAAKRKERALSTLVEQVLLAADRAPLVVVVEDLHWLDPSSLELLSVLIERIDRRRILLLLTSRPGFSAPWTEKPPVVCLGLQRLGTEDILEMVQNLAGNRPVALQLAYQIVNKTDGVPLFVEEFVRSLLQRGRGDLLSAALPEQGGMAIPASLHELLIARLDRSGPAKLVAQAAAVIGRGDIRPDLLAEALQTTADKLRDALALLAEAGLLYPDGGANAVRYRFGHDLVRDAAYDSLLRDHRRDLHARVAHALLRLAPEIAEDQPELLALHLMEGGLPDESIPYWLTGGRRSLARSALTEGNRLLRRALQALDLLPDSPDRVERRLEVMGLLGPVLIALHGPGSTEAHALYVTAYELCQNHREMRSHYPIYWGWWRLSRDFRVMAERASALLTRASDRGDPDLQLQAHHCNWASHYNSGDLDGCLSHIDAGMAIYRSGSYEAHASLYGNHDARVCAHGELAQVYWMQGRTSAALIEEQSSVEAAASLGHLGSIIHAKDMALLHRVYRGDHADVWQMANELIRFASDHGFSDHRAKGLIFRGWAAAHLGDTTSGLEALLAGLERQREIGTREDFPIYACLHAEALAANGRADEGLDELTRARVEFEEIGLRIWLPEVLRVQAEMLMLVDPHRSERALTLLEAAAREAEVQGVAMLGLRIATSQARLLMCERRGKEALQLIRAARAQVPDRTACRELVAADALEGRLLDRRSNVRVDP